MSSIPWLSVVAHAGISVSGGVGEGTGDGGFKSDPYSMRTSFKASRFT